MREVLSGSVRLSKQRRGVVLGDFAHLVERGPSVIESMQREYALQQERCVREDQQLESELLQV
jgi:hypothetical protein